MVKTGYDLSKPYSFTLDEKGKVLHAELPDAEILSIETESQEIFYLSESMISSIDPEEWEDAYRENRLAAERETRSLGILEETRKRAEESAKLREEDYQLAYAIDILKGLTTLNGND